MLLFKKEKDLKAFIQQEKLAGKKVGFVPTMGALHDGHLSLMALSLETTDVTVCSIFVNPTQFNNADDLEKYPRTIENDIVMLETAGVQVLFLPSVEEVYPKNLTYPDFDFNGLDHLMEGEHRPGHFEGVAQVVYRLLDIVQPTDLFMGQKDYQQWRIIQSMLEQVDWDIKLVRCPIARATDGLALSSRNVRLTEEARQIAPKIRQILSKAKAEIQDLSIGEVKNNAVRRLNKIEAFKMDYFEIVDGQSLQLVKDKSNTQSLVACTAVYIANIRLIDNIILKAL